MEIKKASAVIGDGSEHNEYRPQTFFSDWLYTALF